jgi:hypothetical protein
MTPTDSKPRRLYLSNGSKYRLELYDKTTTKGIWNVDKFCWMTSLGRKRIPVELVRRVSVIDSTVTDRSSNYGWFFTHQVFLDKWSPKPTKWVHPYTRPTR